MPVVENFADLLTRCIPKMDHHCPWTSNCVSHFTLPHFMRFLFYATVGMSYLETLLWQRASFVWKNSHLPSVRNSCTLPFRSLKFG